MDSLLRDHPDLLHSLSDSDDFRAVIIGHTYLEAILTLITERKSSHPIDRLDEMSYGLKLKFALALGVLKRERAPTLEWLATMRNDFAHKLGHHSITSDRVLKLRTRMKSLEADVDLFATLLRKWHIDNLSALITLAMDNQRPDATLVRYVFLYMFK